jgi:DNA (cytosine-5)-methyltransferase 1
MPLSYLSVCSGIEAASVAWGPLGFEPVAFAEIEAFPSAVLKHHYPTVPNWGDLSKFKDWPDANVDVLVGGTPCQSFSVAGLRAGLADPRGNLALTYLALADRYRPRWVVWENVPGVLSSAGGRDFGAFLGGLAELGYGFAYRVLDAQYFGLAQRRKRVFVVGYLGDWRRAAAVLFERESLSGHPAPRRTPRQDATCDVRSGVAGSIGAHKTGGWGMELDNSGAFVPVLAKPLGAHALSKGRGTDLDCTTYVAEPVAFDLAGITSLANRSNPEPGAPCHTLHKGAERSVVASPVIEVRRLTPLECERLQGFPDDYTAIPYRGKPAADGPRYKALGNSMAVPCMSWIGRRLKLVDSLQVQEAS